MRVFLAILLSVFCLAAFAADNPAPQRDVPDITYAQKVEIVVDAKKNPMILDLRIDQDKDNVSIVAIVDKNTDRIAAKQLASDLVMLTKSLTLDDRPTDTKSPGKGLYNYGVKISRVDAVVLVTGTKMANEKDVKIDAPMMENLPPDLRPLTRADGRP